MRSFIYSTNKAAAMPYSVCRYSTTWIQTALHVEDGGENKIGEVPSLWKYIISGKAENKPES